MTGGEEGGPGRDFRAVDDRAELGVRNSQRDVAAVCSRCRALPVCRWFNHADEMGDQLPDDLRAEYRRHQLEFRLRGLAPVPASVAALFTIDGRHDRAAEVVLLGVVE